VDSAALPVGQADLPAAASAAQEDPLVLAGRLAAPVGLPVDRLAALTAQAQAAPPLAAPAAQEDPLVLAGRLAGPVGLPVDLLAALPQMPPRRRLPHGASPSSLLTAGAA
jgi:hypothetical protein